ncbi:MAG: hypothetical protein JW816_04725 [Candidatus Buchananbacteria bacterium]|nr:hypothetical protein [Candidatus Buchananbacteria bacterium]
MLRALQTGLTLLVVLAILKAFLPEVFDLLVQLITQVIDILLYAVDQANRQLPR